MEGRKRSGLRDYSDRADRASSQPSGADTVLSRNVQGRRNSAALLRIYVSQKAAGKDKALFDFLGLDQYRIQKHYANHPRNIVEAVQAALMEWAGSSPPKTWKMLVDAMNQAEFAVQEVRGLTEELQKAEETVENLENLKTDDSKGHPLMLYFFGVVLLLSVGLGLWQFHWVGREPPKTWLKEHLPKGEPHLNVVEEKRDIGKTRKLQSHVGAITASDEALRDELTRDAPENDAVLSQAVHSDRNYAVILRRHVSSKAAVRGKALLELLGFDTAEIDTFYANNPSNVEEAVHVGLLKWVEREPPKTWKELTEAMKEADIAQQHIEGLKEHLLKGEPHLNVVDRKKDIGKTRKLQSHVGAITANDEALRDELTRDGGYRTDIYSDSMGNRIVGIGHLILPRDPEHGKPTGTRVTDARVQEFFTQDINIALADCQAVFPTFSSLPHEAQRVIANMMFNLGRPRLGRFRKLIAAVNARDWSKAAVEMKDSKWYWQVGDRSKRLVRRMQDLAKSEAESGAAGTSNSGL